MPFILVTWHLWLRMKMRGSRPAVVFDSKVLSWRVRKMCEDVNLTYMSKFAYNHIETSRDAIKSV
ncbi:MAG TPA: hypothetical protein DCP36_04675 [Sporomusaceae bacterium]|nr:hypothetical protein [Sporomusaceae bacterium]